MAYLTIAPLLAVAIGALLGVLLEAVVPRRARFVAQTWLAAAVIVVALGFTGRNWWDDTSRRLAGFGSVSVDTATVIIWAGLLVFGLGSVVLAAQRFAHAPGTSGVGVSSFTPMAVAAPGSVDEREAEAKGGEHTEVFPLMMFALTGMLLLPAASDLLTAFIGLEVLSLPLYLLTALARRRRLISHEAALKYFLLGAFSSAVYLYGAALVYGYASSSEYCGAIRQVGQAGGEVAGCGADFRAIDMALANTLGRDPLLLAGFGLLMVGLLFKVGAVPFHAWVPDTYTGAPTPVTAYMAVGTKVASVGALMRLLYVAFGGLQWTWLIPVAIVAALTMAVGSVFGLTQTNIKRLLAYSSIAHVGFVLAPIAAAVSVTTIEALTSMSAVVYYLAAYGLATLGAFAVVMVVRDGTGEVVDLAAWAGIGRRHPWVGAAMTLFLCSLAGIPATAGFIGKIDAFVVAWQGGLWWLVLLGLVFSLVAMVFYMRVVLTIWFAKAGEQPAAPAPEAPKAPEDASDDDAPTAVMQAVHPDDEAPAAVEPEVPEEPDDAPPASPVAGVDRVPKSLAILMGLCAAGTLAAGLYPGLFTHLASLAGQLLR